MAGMPGTVVRLESIKDKKALKKIEKQSSVAKNIVKQIANPVYIFIRKRSDALLLDLFAVGNRLNRYLHARFTAAQQNGNVSLCEIVITLLNIL